MIDRLAFGWVFLAVFAAYRLTMLITYDYGPWDCFDRLRTWAGCYEYGADRRPEKMLGRLLACPYCVGVWMGAFCALLLVTFHPAAYLFIAAMAIAGAQFIAVRLTEGE